jgi:hypothetical protein
MAARLLIREVGDKMALGTTCYILRSVGHRRNRTKRAVWEVSDVDWEDVDGKSKGAWGVYLRGGKPCGYLDAQREARVTRTNLS